MVWVALDQPPGREQVLACQPAYRLLQGWQVGPPPGASSFPWASGVQGAPSQPGCLWWGPEERGVGLGVRPAGSSERPPGRGTARCPTQNNVARLQEELKAPRFV